MNNCECNLPQSKKDELRYRQIAGRLPLLKGSIIRPDGTVIDICDLIGVPKSPVDPQLARAQNLFPYIRDTVILEDGQTCSLVDLIDRFIQGFNDTKDLDKKFTAYINELKGLLRDLEDYIEEVERQANEVYTHELRLTHYTPTEGDWLNGN